MIRSVFKVYLNVLSSRLFWAAHAFLFFGMLGVALFYQYSLSEEPCPLCVLIRAFVFGMAIVSSIMAIFPKKEVFTMGILALILLGCHALIISIEAYQIEIGQIIATCGFEAPFPSWLPLHNILPFMFDPTGLCGKSPVMFFDFTMSEILVGIFLVLEANFLISSLPTVFYIFSGKK